jgi:hypothetical protein
VSITFARYLGVDFSAAETDGGHRTWIAGGIADGRELIINSLQPASALPGSGPRREAFLPALCRFLAARTDTLAGLDVPFSLPADHLETDDWAAFVTGFAQRYPDPQAFRDACRRRDGGRERKRRCDIEARTPFCAHNLRLYRQTYWALVSLLAPLVRDRRVRVAPMFQPAEARVMLAEICPASTLKRLGCYGSYKGAGAVLRNARAAIIDRLADHGLALPTTLAVLAVDNVGGDALDAAIAAFAAWQAGRDPEPLFVPRDRIDRLEARIYF